MLSSTIDFLNAPAIQHGALTASRAELLGAALGIWMVLCTLRVHPLAWPLAIASSALYLLVFGAARLYGDAALQVVFILLAVWGWWQWLHGTKDGQVLTVHRLTSRERWLAVSSLAVLWPAIGLLLQHSTDTDVPYWDAFPTAASLIGQALLGRKLVENWPVWVAVNVVATGLFAYKGLWLTVGLYVVFAALALVGWRQWALLADPTPAAGRATDA